MVVQSLKLKNKSYYFWDDVIYLDDIDSKLLKNRQKRMLVRF